MRWRTISFGALFVAATSIALSSVHPWGNVRNVTPSAQILQGIEVPEDVRGILEKKCADCHSNNTHWPAYSRTAPISWLLEHDIRAGRSALNLSMWNAMSAGDRINALAGIAAAVRSSEMPPKPYAMIHAAGLTESEKQKITAWSRTERKHLRTPTSGEKEQK